MRIAIVIALALFIPGLVSVAGETVVNTAIHGDTLSFNGQPTRLGATHWSTPEKSWRTVGELMKTTVPPADAAGNRKNVVVAVDLDEKAPWGALKALVMASAGLGIPKARIQLPGAAKKTLSLSLPGADPSVGKVVDFPLLEGAKGELLTENGGRKMPCSDAVLQGLVKQQPEATIHVIAPTSLPAHGIAKLLVSLEEAKAHAIAYLPVKEITKEEAVDRQKAKDAVDRAFGGALGGALGGKDED